MTGRSICETDACDISTSYWFRRPRWQLAMLAGGLIRVHRGYVLILDQTVWRPHRALSHHSVEQGANSRVAKRTVRYAITISLRQLCLGR